MSGDIKVGDVCVVVDGCCPATRRIFVGHVCEVVKPCHTYFYCRCGFRSSSSFVVEYAVRPIVDGIAVGPDPMVPAIFLRKIPPKQKVEADQHADFDSMAGDDKPNQRTSWRDCPWRPRREKEGA